MKLEVGREIVYEKVFTIEEVEAMGQLMGFRGRHHEIPNERGQLLNQGLLTAILTNKIGGEYNILAYRMEFDLVRKVWTGEKIRAVNRVVETSTRKGRLHVVIESKLYNPAGDLVLGGILKGIQLDYKGE